MQVLSLRTKVTINGGRKQTMRTYSWWLGRKHRVRKKYTLLLGMYYSPKELREWVKESVWFKKKKKHDN